MDSFYQTVCKYIFTDGLTKPSEIHFMSYRIKCEFTVVHFALNVKFEKKFLSPSVHVLSASTTVLSLSLSLSLSQFSHQGTTSRRIKPSPPFEGMWSDSLSQLRRRFRTGHQLPPRTTDDQRFL